MARAQGARSLMAAAFETTYGTFDWQAARDPILGRMCTATLINDVETY